MPSSTAHAKIIYEALQIAFLKQLLECHIYHRILYILDDKFSKRTLLISLIESPIEHSGTSEITPIRAGLHEKGSLISEKTGGKLGEGGASKKSK